MISDSRRFVEICFMIVFCEVVSCPSSFFGSYGVRSSCCGSFFFCHMYWVVVPILLTKSYGVYNS